MLENDVKETAQYGKTGWKKHRSVFDERTDALMETIGYEEEHS